MQNIGVLAWIVSASSICSVFPFATILALTLSPLSLNFVLHAFYCFLLVKSLSVVDHWLKKNSF